MVALQALVAAMALSGVSQTVLLDFYSDSCGPCREMNPTVQSLIAAGYPVQRVNVTQNPRLAAKYGVRSIPCFVMVVNGREVGREVGLTPISRLQQMCQMGVAAPAAPRAPPMLAMNSAPPAQPIAHHDERRKQRQPIAREPSAHYGPSSPSSAGVTLRARP